MSANTLVRNLVVNVGDVNQSDARLTLLFTNPDSGMTVTGVEFPIHKPNRSIKVAGRENVGRPSDAQVGWTASPPGSAFWPTAPLTTGQDTQTDTGCAVSATAALTVDGQGNYVQLALIAYDPAAPAVGLCVAWVDINAVDATIARARFTDMNVVERYKYVSRQSNITLVVLPGITTYLGHAANGCTPGAFGPTLDTPQPGLTITGLTAQLEYEIYA